MLRLGDQPLGEGDGEAPDFALIKRYASGGAWVDRPIVKPVAGTVRVAVGGVEKTSGVDFTVDTTTGLITFASAPALGAAVTAGFEFDAPVRFDVDRLEVSRDAFGAGAAPDAPVIEILI